jgi:tryptophan synthase alpha chain
VVASVRHEAPDALTAVGIGISTGEQAAAVNQYADGAIVGSAFVRAYQEGGLDGLRQKVRDIVSGLNK